MLPPVFATAIALAAYAYVPGSATYPTVTGLRSRFLDTAVARFHYLREGSGSPLVLLPGGTASTYAWQPQLAALSAGHTVYVVDLPGQGYTEPRDPHFAYDLPAMEAAIGAFLDAAGLDRVDLAGHSWSGGWALDYAQSHPERVRRLVLLASSGLAVRDVASWEILKTPALGELVVNLGYTRDAVQAGIADLFVHKERATPELAEAMWRPLTARPNLRSIYELERGLDWRRTQRRMPATPQPTLIIWGAQDTILPSWQAARFAALMPHAQATIIDGCGHAITLDCPDEVNALMRAFLS
ncbi:alpha/beta fold hydrolase [Micromonospora sp. NPDC048930]|uniref:alpha/beta fold hydrolase n=1 Tax=Micromonospora sp. NPDC048930 TaxID=3364261 RepID=UPI00371808BF